MSFIRKYFIVGLILVSSNVDLIYGQGLETDWSKSVDKNLPLPEYPRPQFVRKNWVNLNGVWDYAIRPVADSAVSGWQGKILVPFSVESALSGVGKTVGKNQRLVYRRTLKLSSSLTNKTVLLHFGGVDWRCDVFVNGKKAGSHEGGYDPFAFDVTKFLKKSGEQELVVNVWDPSDEGPQPRGKQVVKPEGIWYTPVTGIWQTVWLETVNKTYISSIKQIPDIDTKQIKIKPHILGFQNGDIVRITAFDGQQKIGEIDSKDTSQVSITIPSPKLWSPSSPHLYDLKISLIRKGKALDEIQSYFAMRKISMKADDYGVQRMLLNDKFVFQYGPLDQGWWPDGLYTAPTDEALKSDIVKTKELGFNMIRKHVKVEPARWYYHCDQLGMLVWQDMPSGDMGNRWDSRPAIVGLATEKERSIESEKIFRKEWKAIMDALSNFPCIVVWVPFNEAWGQFKTDEIVTWTMSYDSSRLVNAASGGNFFPTGHIIDLHNYPEPAMPDPKLFGKERIIVLGEFGGLGLPVDSHTWQKKDNWGYQSFASKEELMTKYKEFVKKLEHLKANGLSAAVYTQTTDVETEVNGLMTYDRKMIKFDPAEMRAIHAGLYKDE
jgi:beta-galactosidase/beta-glucuronidase